MRLNYLCWIAFVAVSAAPVYAAGPKSAFSTQPVADAAESRVNNLTIAPRYSYSTEVFFSPNKHLYSNGKPAIMNPYRPLIGSQMEYKINWGRCNKCNVFVGDSLYQAKFATPIESNGHYTYANDFHLNPALRPIHLEDAGPGVIVQLDSSPDMGHVLILASAVEKIPTPVLSPSDRAGLAGCMLDAPKSKTVSYEVLQMRVYGAESLDGGTLKPMSLFSRIDPFKMFYTPDKDIAAHGGVLKILASIDTDVSVQDPKKSPYKVVCGSNRHEGERIRFLEPHR